MDYVLGKNDCGWYIWSRKRNAWLMNDGWWSKDTADHIYWTDPTDPIRLLRNKLGVNGNLEVGSVSNI